MKLRIARSALVEAVSQASKAVSQKTTLPILTGMKVTLEEDSLTFTGSNSDMTISVKVPRTLNDKELLVVDRLGSVVVPGKVFGDIVRKLPGDQVDWEVNERFQLSIRSGQSEFQLNGLDPEEYPRVPQLSTDQRFSIATDTLKAMIRQTVFAAATNEAKKELTGVHFMLQDGILTCVATDSHRLARRRVKVENAQELELSNVVIPSKSLQELAKTFADYEGDVNFIITENQILVEHDTIAFYSRLLDGKYPDTDRVIPKAGDTSITVSTKELLQSVERASLISREKSDNVIKWTIGQDQVEVTSVSHEIGSVSEEVTARVNGQGLGISFNARYMLEALRSLESDQVEIVFTGPMTPFKIQPKDADDTLQLIVPIRTR
ncbi:DNA polymerase III subunit beta [Risungbinella massiliensis]|uniref:DNA polymerase III subunit beta n=1 Tax=Risungbinella massiliensis TaxID=1329796 RepID=UPI0005CC3C25|nr:DNA polymerase III subunit beta [Risungbinella massiliensis]